LTDLVHQAEKGDAYCSTTDCALVPEPDKDPAWDGTDFFDLWADDEENEVPAKGPGSPDQETKSTSTAVPHQQVRAQAGDGQPLPTETPHFWPQCLTGYGCEDKPCATAYESTCKSCIVRRR
jgi:hypothetical protein